MATFRGPAQALVTCGAALFLLSGCGKFASDGGGNGTDAAADFARAALERNEQISVVAFDKKENTFTVRVKDTGELHIVRVDQIIGTVPGVTSGEGKPRPVSDEKPSNGETTASTSEPAAAPPLPAEEPARTGEIARPGEQAGTQEQSRAVAKSGSNGAAVITDPRTGAVLAQ